MAMDEQTFEAYLVWTLGFTAAGGAMGSMTLMVLLQEALGLSAIGASLLTSGGVFAIVIAAGYKAEQIRTQADEEEVIPDAVD